MMCGGELVEGWLMAVCGSSREVCVCVSVCNVRSPCRNHRAVSVVFRVFVVCYVRVFYAYFFHSYGDY